MNPNQRGLGFQPATDLVVPPIIRRELLTALRSNDPRKRRTRITWIGAGIATIFMIAHALGASFSFSRGLLDWLLYVGLYVAVPETLQLTAGMFTQERQNRTLGFLFLAGLGMPEIFFSKIAGSLLIASTDLIALAPFIAIPFLGGGVSFTLFFAAICCLPVLMLLMLALSALGSVLCEDENAALFCAVGIGVALCLATPAVYWFRELAGRRISTQWLVFSPAYGPWLVAGGFISKTGAEFWRNCEVTLLFALLIFGVAAIVLRTQWREETRGVAARNWGGWLREIWRGGKARRVRLARWLDVNPYVWLAAHNVAPERLGWLTLAAIGVVWSLGWLLVGRYWLIVLIILLTATGLNLAFEAIVCYTAAKFIAQNRRDSGIEILLTTPLEVTQMVEGQFKASQTLFKGLLAGILAAEAGLALIGYSNRGWNWRATVVYIIIWAALMAWPVWRYCQAPWRSMWVSLNSGRAYHSGQKGRWRWIWIIINLRNVFRYGFFSMSSNGFPSGSVVEFFFAVFFAFIGILIAFAVAHADGAKKEQTRLILHFRAVAEEPLPEANDPRLKEWNIEMPFPRRFGIRRP